MIIDLGALANVEGVDFDGLVGYEMFRRFGVTIDYAGHTLTLAEPAKFAPPAGASVVPFELSDTTPLVAGTLDGAPVRMSVDTGSRASLSMHSPFVREHDLVAQYNAAPEAVVGWGVGGPSRGRPARFGTLKLGDREINGVVGDLYTGDKGAFANPDMSGNLGGGVLRRFTVAFDYGAKRMYLAPNADFAKPDEFDRSGLFLLGDGDALLVADVAPDSAAARAGLQGERSHRRDRRRGGGHEIADRDGARSCANCRWARASRSSACAMARRKPSRSCWRIASQRADVLRADAAAAHTSSSRRKPGSILIFRCSAEAKWVPAFAGTTVQRAAAA